MPPCFPKILRSADSLVSSYADGKWVSTTDAGTGQGRGTAMEIGTGRAYKSGLSGNPSGGCERRMASIARGRRARPGTALTGCDHLAGATLAAMGFGDGDE